MCKAKQEIHMLQRLWPVISKQQKASTVSIQDAMTMSEKPPRFFMYVNSRCGFSRKAFNYIQNTMLKDIKNKSDYFTVVSTTDRLFACPEQPWKIGDGPTLLPKEENIANENNVLLQQLLGCWDSVIQNKDVHSMKTWPQVFIHTHPDWHYVGGADDTLKLTPIAANTRGSEVGPSDLIHLLPMVTKEAGNQPTQLKF